MKMILTHCIPMRRNAVFNFCNKYGLEMRYLFHICSYSTKFTLPNGEVRILMWHQNIFLRGENYHLGWDTMQPGISLLISLKTINKLLHNYMVTHLRRLYSSQSLPWDSQISHTLEKGHGVYFLNDNLILEIKYPVLDELSYQT